MTHSGTMKLIYKGQVNKQVVYRNLPERKRIIEQWRVIYGIEFEKCAIQIVPDITEKENPPKRAG